MSYIFGFIGLMLSTMVSAQGLPNFPDLTDPKNSNSSYCNSSDPSLNDIDKCPKEMVSDYCGNDKSPLIDLLKCPTDFVASLLWAPMRGSGDIPIKPADLAKCQVWDNLTREKVTTRGVPQAPINVSRRLEFGISFENNSNALTSKGKLQIERLAMTINAATAKQEQRKFSIEGHANRTGNEDRNKRLSCLRAAAVREILIKKYNIADERIEAIIGYGSEKPLENVSPIDGINRRVSIGVFAN